MMARNDDYNWLDDPFDEKKARQDSLAQAGPSKGLLGLGCVVALGLMIALGVFVCIGVANLAGSC